MAFHTLEYALFLPLALLACLAAGRFRPHALLAASLLFYLAAGRPVLLLWLAAAAAAAWLYGRAAARAPDGASPPGSLFAVATAAQLAILAAARFEAAAAGAAALGVSYFAFQAVAYQADIHLGRVAPERDARRLLLYLCLFPKLLQGPIERAERLLPQLSAPAPLTYAALRGGILLILLGLVKKCAFADRFGLYVDRAFDAPELFAGPALLLALYLYALQIYLDFSAYTDIARGSARLFGIELSDNFRLPYAALDIADFWRRWHITLSAFILDYIFRPLQMALRDRGAAGTCAALLAAFLLCGLWHGATGPFLAWGLWHGAALCAHFMYRRAAGRRRAGPLRDLAARLLTFHTVLAGWLLFRSPTLPFAAAYLARIPSPGGMADLALPTGHPFHLALTLALALAVPLAEWRCGSSDGLAGGVTALPAPARWTVYLLLLLALMLLGVPSADGRFGYFRF